MKPAEAAAKLREAEFKCEPLPPHEQRIAQFVADVASELGVEHTPHNLDQVAAALHAAGCEPDPNEWPKMLFGKAPSDDFESVYDPRRRLFHVVVHNDKELAKLGEGWHENPKDAMGKDGGAA